MLLIQKSTQGGKQKNIQCWGKLRIRGEIDGNHLYLRDSAEIGQKKTWIKYLHNPTHARDGKTTARNDQKKSEVTSLKNQSKG